MNSTNFQQKILDYFISIISSQSFPHCEYRLWDQMITMNKSAILLVNDWWSQNNHHFQLLQIIHEQKSPPRNPGLFGHEHLIVINSSL
jgi:hypothetical protein